MFYRELNSLNKTVYPIIVKLRDVVIGNATERVERRLKIKKNMNFRKISAVLSSGIMAVSTIGFAAAANYPNPFVVGGSSNVAIVYGTGEGVSSLDVVQAGNIQSNLQSFIGGGTTTTGGSVSGEAIELFSGGTKIYVNDSLNSVKSVLTKADLPTVLKDQSFSGNVDATQTHTLELGSNPRITFKKQPTSSDNPQFALETSTSTANYIYNASVTFSKAVNFTHADSQGETMNIFGQTYTVSSATDTSDLVLLQSAERISLTSDAPSTEVTIGGGIYTIELVSASDTSATIKVTDSSGSSETKEINEAQSKKIKGLTVAVTTADETNLKLSATVVAGSEKITLTSGSEVTMGEEETVVDGATAYFTGGTGAMTKLVVSVVAPESDKDAIKTGESFTDPVFKTFKLNFAGFNIGEDSTARETITIGNSGDDKMQITFTDHTLNTKTVMFAKNRSATFELFVDDDNRNLSVLEAEIVKYQDYVVIGNEDEAHLLKLSSVNNGSTGFTNDRARFVDIFTGDTLDTVFTSDNGVGTLTVGGKTYTVTVAGAANIASEDYTVRINWAESSGAGQAVIYPTIQTSKGARIAFYEPKTINLGAWDGTNALTQIDFPDGDGYTSISSIVSSPSGVSPLWNFTSGGTVNQLNTSLAADTSSFTASIGRLTYNITTTGTANQTKIMLKDVSGVNINQPGLVIFEEKDDNNIYEALIVKLENGATSDDGIGIDDVERTWSSDSTDWEWTLPGDSKLEKSADLWGTIITTDSSDSDQKSATISYPDEQIYALLYMASETASITPGTTTSGGTQLGEVLVKDTEVGSVSSKNLIIVGGSCINSAAATVLGVTKRTCGSAFTSATNVGSGQFLIKGVSGAYTTGKIALVVAGYDAADTVNAAKYLTTQTVDTSKEYRGTSSTSATLVTTTA